MYTGHFAVALGGVALARRLPLWLLILSAFACDAVEAVLKMADASDPSRVWSHSLPVATGAGIVLAVGWRMTGGSFGEALLLCAVAMSHTALDFITGMKAVWPGIAPMGLDLYHRPYIEAAIEGAFCVAGWWLWRRSVPGPRQASRGVWAMLATLLLAQAAATVHLVLPGAR